VRASALAITGMGVVSAAGTDAETTLSRFRQPPAPPTDAVTAGLSRSITAPVFALSQILPGQADEAETSRTIRLALVAAAAALRQAGLDHTPAALARCGVCLGTTVACQLNDLPFYREFRERGQPSLTPATRFLSGNLAATVATRLGCSGPCLTVANACSSGADALGVAAAWLRCGLCDLVLAGGADELNLIPLAGFHALGVMSPAPCAPFDRDRSGLNLGEGAGILVLESFAHARRRGATPLLALAGFGAAGDAHHLTAPDPEGKGLEQAIRTALAEAGAQPDAVAFVNAHGTATLDNDRVEAKTLLRIFGPRLRYLSTKGYTGHTLGAAGAIEAIFTGLNLRDGWLPPSAGFRQPPNDQTVAPTRTITPLVGNCALSTSLAFGGNNAAVLLRLPAPSDSDAATGLQVPAPANVLGAGIVCATAGSQAELLAVLAAGSPAPTTLLHVPGFADPLPCLPVPERMLASPALSRTARRADRFSRMAMLAAGEAWEHGRAVGVTLNPLRTGLIVATALGPHARTFAFLDGILDFGDLAASPTDFSHSVHNAAAAYIAIRLGLRGPTLTVTDFNCGFAQAVLLGQCWLASGSCDHVLVGAVEELGDVLLHVTARLLTGKPWPVPAEGAAFLLLGRDGHRLPRADATPEDSAKPTDLMLDDAPCVPSADRPQQRPPAANSHLDLAPLFGNSFHGCAFRTVAAATLLQHPALAASLLPGQPVPRRITALTIRPNGTRAGVSLTG